MDNLEKFDLFEYHYRSKHEVLISYKGPFDKEVLTVIGSYIKIILGKNPMASKRIFKIFMELAQNVSYYSTERNILEKHAKSGIGTLAIIEQNDNYTFHTGNEITNNSIIEVIEKCEIINALDKNGLREYKRKQLRLPDGVFGGANIGLIQVALTSMHPIEFKAVPIDDKISFLGLTVRINK